MSVSVKEVIQNWNEKDLANLAALLGLEKNSSGIDNIENRVKWLFHSKTRAKIQSGTQNFLKKVSSSISKSQYTPSNENELTFMPSYKDLVYGAAKKLKVYEEDAKLNKLEIYISQAIIVSALNNMRPAQREDFFSRDIDAKAVFEDADSLKNNINGPMTSSALLGVAGASGFGLYAASTTALGFVTHAVGITLPFAVYTGLTSSIAFVIGPAGWLAISFWGFLKLTKTEWDKLIPALLYIMAVNSHRALVKV